MEFPPVPRSGIEQCLASRRALVLRVRGRRVLHDADLHPDRELRGPLPARIEGRPLQSAAHEQVAGNLLVRRAAGDRADDVHVGSSPLPPPLRTARRRARGLRRRQAMDVEDAAFRGPGRDQRTAHPAGEADQADDDLGGRDPQLLHPRLPGETGRAPGPQYLDVVRADARSDATTSSAPSTAGRTIRPWAAGFT